MKKPLYTVRFESTARCLVDEEADQFLAKASLEKLKPLLSKNVQWDERPEFLPIVGDGTTINRVNRNGHGILFDKAAELARITPYSFLDVEHDRKKIVGVVVSAGFAKFGSNELLSEDDIKDLKEPFNFCIGAAVYKTIYPKLTEKIIESNDPTSDFFQRISLSWEIGFSGYNLLLGSRNLADGELVTDPKQIEELSAYLKTKAIGKDGKEKEVRKGFGKTPDGVSIYTVVTDNIIAMGYGLVSNPAADVKGILAVDEGPDIIEEDNEEEDSSASINTPDSITIQSETPAILEEEKSATNENSTSHKNQACVNQIEMKIASEAELRAKLSEAKVSEEVIASVVEFTAKASSPAVDQMNEALRKANEQYVAEKTSREEKEKAVANLQTEVSTAKAELDKVNKALEELQTTVAQREKQDKFQTRLAGLDSEYNLEDEDRKVITNQIKDLDDTGYESWFGGFKVLAAAKKKVPAKDGEKPGDKKNDKEPDKDMDDKASASKVAEEVIASAKPVSSEVPNTSSTSSLKKKYELSKTAFQVVR